METNMKTLIAYFSHTGENYFGGAIRNISKGNTAVVAEFAQILVHFFHHFGNRKILRNSFVRGSCVLCGKCVVGKYLVDGGGKRL